MIPDPSPHSVHLDGGTGASVGARFGADVGVGVDVWGEYDFEALPRNLVTRPMRGDRQRRIGRDPRQEGEGVDAIVWPWGPVKRIRPSALPFRDQPSSCTAW
jgi:hypothetical protein